MSNQQIHILTKHKLEHLPELKVSASLFNKGFAGGCSMKNCSAECCHGGVLVDISERDNILAHGALIQRHMEPEQEHDVNRWFDGHEVVDHDFPSGRAIGTEATKSGCVFLKRDGKCVLQTSAEAENLDRYVLRPFYCIAYPVAIIQGELIIDDELLTGREECCSALKGGELHAIDVLEGEFRHVLGEEGFTELKNLAITPGKQPYGKIPISAETISGGK